jgi:hypothetical protein
MPKYLNLEVEGYQAFSEILKTLKEGRDVPQDRWDELNGYPGYAKGFEIMEREMGVSKKEFIGWVTKGVRKGPPRYLRKLQWFTNQGRTRLFSNYAIEHLDDIQGFIKNCKDSEPPILKWVTERLRKYLPPTIEIPSTSLYLVFGSGDGRIFDDVATFDATLMYILGEDNAKGIFAHELHHVARNGNFGTWVNFKGLKYFIATLEAEGVADMVFSIHASRLAREDMPIVSMLMQSGAQYSHVDEILAALDKVISDAYPREPKPRDIYPLFSKNAYHPVGHTMACRIENRMGVQRLVSTVGNPVDFFIAYQSSVEGGEGYRFSAKTMEMVEKVCCD